MLLLQLAHQSTKNNLLVIVGFVFSCHVILTFGVIVDGDKKEEISPVKHQKKDINKTIDSYNVRTCGLSDTDFGESEFVNMARAGQFPWIVSFQIKFETADKGGHLTNDKNRTHGDMHFCSGSFITDRWILSAAHCFTSKWIRKWIESDMIHVVAGSQFVNSRKAINKNLTISRVFYHGRFNLDESPIGFDIALVELEQPVELETNRTVDRFGEQARAFFNAGCLPLKNHRYQFNDSARVAGWGLSNIKDPKSMPSKLLVTDILIADSQDCAKKYAKELNSDRAIHQLSKYDDFICASYHTTRDTCQSDSGGPLMQYVGGKAVLIGIVSYGIGCAKEGIPGVYTRTSAYINWIRDIIHNGMNSGSDFQVLQRKVMIDSSEDISDPSQNSSSSTSTSRPFDDRAQVIHESCERTESTMTSFHSRATNATQQPA